MLALTAAERRTAGQLLTAFFDAYEESLSAAPIVPNLDRPALESLSVPDTGLGVDGFFRFVSETLLPNSTTIAHPRFLAYVLGSPTGVLLTFGVATFRTALDNCLEVGRPPSRHRRAGGGRDGAAGTGHSGRPAGDPGVRRQLPDDPVRCGRDRGTPAVPRGNAGKVVVSGPVYDEFPDIAARAALARASLARPMKRSSRRAFSPATSQLM